MIDVYRLALAWRLASAKRRAWPWLLALTTLTLAATAPAQPHTTLPTTTPGAPANLVPVPAPHARHIALGEAQGLLAFAHDKDHADGQASLIKLDAKGSPAAYAVTWKLPAPEPLKKFGTYGLAVAFHPKLPLLYVWQDVAVLYTNPPQPGPPELKQLDHLLVYNVAKEPPELVVALCRGGEYAHGMQGGGLVVDPAGEYLYVPNLRDAKNAGLLRFGRFKLDADGLPVVDEKDAALPLPARAKKLGDLNVTKGVAPAELTPPEYVYLFAMSGFGSGHSFLPVSKDAVLAGGASGLMGWRPGDKVGTLHGLPLKGHGHTLLAGHPSLPVVYATSFGTDSFYRVEQHEGYLSLLPHQFMIPGEKLTSPPAVVGKDRLAVGGQFHVYLVPLDAKGQVQAAATKVQVLNPSVRALVYSPRFDKLYVGVEHGK